MKNTIIKWNIGGLLFVLVYWLGYETPRSDFPQLITLYGIFFLTYLGVFHFTTAKKTIAFFAGSCAKFL